MKKRNNYLAIDLGASSGRGIIGWLDDERIHLREISRFTNDPVKVNGRLYWDILRIFHEIKGAIRQSVLEGFNLASIGIDTWGVSYGFINKDGNLVSNPVHYRDVRTDGVIEKASKTVSVEELYKVTGIQSIDLNTIYQLYAEKNEPSGPIAFSNNLLFIPDLLNYFLTGKKFTEYTIASTGAILDAKNRNLAEDILAKFDIKKELFAPFVMPGNRVGKLLPEIIEDIGYTNATVVNVAAHDTASAVIAVPTQDKEFIYISSGTWSLMGTELDEPLINEDSCRMNYTNEGGYGGKIRFLKNIMGLWLIQESRRQWKREGKDYCFADLETAAREAKPFACFIDPDDKRFSSPGNLPRRIAEYCRETGQKVPTSVGEVVRCIYESLALKYRYTVVGLCGLTSIKPNAINIVGGGSQDKLLNQMTANACGINVVAGPTEATALGNIVVQAIAEGEIKDIKEARRIIANSFETVLYEPKNTERWDIAYERFEKLINN